MSLHKYEGLLLKIYITAMPVLSVFISDVMSILFIPFAFVLDFIFNLETIKILSQLFGMCGGFLVFLGGFWYVSKMIFESRKAKYESRIKELEVNEKEKDNDLWQITKRKMVLEEKKEHLEEELAINEKEIQIRELQDKLKGYGEQID